MQEITDGGIDELLNMPPEKQREFAERAKIQRDIMLNCDPLEIA